ncbi:unnamed protein product, partial [Bubo scandiacus]
RMQGRRQGQQNKAGKNTQGSREVRNIRGQQKHTSLSKTGYEIREFLASFGLY